MMMVQKALLMELIIIANTTQDWAKKIVNTLSGFDIVYDVGMAAQTSKILTWKSEILRNFQLFIF